MERSTTFSMPTVDPTRLARVLAQLAPDDQTWLSEVLEPPSIARQRRLALRDHAIGQLGRLMADPSGRVTVTARMIERALTRYLASAWRTERDLLELPSNTRAHHQLLHRVAQLNRGTPLSARSIFNALQPTEGEISSEPAEGERGERDGLHPTKDFAPA